jgi:hypothetical protein
VTIQVTDIFQSPILESLALKVKEVENKGPLEVPPFSVYLAERAMRASWRGVQGYTSSTSLGSKLHNEAASRAWPSK